MNDTEIECPECGFTFYMDCSGGEFLRVEDAAERLLREYTGEHPNTGDVMRLEARIRDILISEFGISEGRF